MVFHYIHTEKEMYVKLLEAKQSLHRYCGS
jgi:hypothetical protein